jgi:hypothetical protein
MLALVVPAKLHPMKTRSRKRPAPMYDAELTLLGPADAAVYAASRGDLAMFKVVAAQAKAAGVLDVCRCMEAMPAAAGQQTQWEALFDYAFEEFVSL